jgi:hypothetical protein
VALTVTASMPSYRTHEKQVFYEPGAVNEFGEYRWWLHVWQQDHKEVTSNIYPWPFAYPWATTMEPDAELLAAFMHTTKMRNWPGGWPKFFLDGVVSIHDPTPFYWKLAPGISKQLASNIKYPAYQIPEVFLASLRNR